MPPTHTTPMKNAVTGRRTSRFRRLRALAAIPALLGLAALSGRWYVRSSEPDRRDFVVAGLEAPVEVNWDRFGIPSIQSQSEKDLYRALGFVHAQDRLWQMDFLRRVSLGRLSEILGSDQIDTDRFLRTLGMGIAAEQDVALLDDEERALLQSYADGINAWITQHTGALPPEFLALRYEPEQWTVRDSLAVGKVMAWDESVWENEIALQSAADIVGSDREHDLEPFYPEWGPRTLGASAEWKGPRDGREHASGKTAMLDAEPRVHIVLPRGARSVLAKASMATASNAWVIAGSRTRSGKPILANDMHLPNQVPSIWYLAALRGGKTNVCGMTLPGLPFVMAGHSSSVAWGFTASLVDDVDFFEEKLSADNQQYETPEGMRPIQTRMETIRVRDAAPVEHEVRSTRHGPLLSDVEKRGGHRALAMRWTALDPSRSTTAFRSMNEATTVNEFTDGLRQMASPTLNVLYASADGTIGYHLAGRVPLRRAGDGVLPVSGWSGEFDWIRYLEFDELPHVQNPSEGFIASANNRIVGDEYPFVLTRSWSEPYRVQRIGQLVRDGADFTASAVAKQQTDWLDPHAVRILPQAIRAAERTGDSDTARALHAWNGEARPDSRAAAVFYAWFEALRIRVAEDEYRGNPILFSTMALDRILEDGGGSWVDDIRTPNVESLDEQSAAAMRSAIQSVGMKKWGELLSTSIPHRLGSSRVLQALLGINIGPYSNGGSNHTLNVAGYDGKIEGAVLSTFGASQRSVVDMADPDATGGGFVLQTGQSGISFSAHYRDQTPAWLRGELIPIPLDAGRTRKQATMQQKLLPR